MNKDDGKQEGPRAFSVFIQELDGGSHHQDLSKALHKVTSELYELALNTGSKKGVKGAVTLKLNLTVKSNGAVEIEPDIDTKIPKPARNASLMFVTKGGNLSVENERQLKLGIREVKTEKQPARDVTDAAEQETRSV